MDHFFHLFAIQSVEPFHEAVDIRSGFQILEDGGDGHACAFQNSGAADFAGTLSTAGHCDQSRVGMVRLLASGYAIPKRSCSVDFLPDRQVVWLKSDGFAASAKAKAGPSTSLGSKERSQLRSGCQLLRGCQRSQTQSRALSTGAKAFSV